MNKHYVYVYERLGVPLYIGIGSDPNYVRAKNVRTGHPSFTEWCKEKFGGIKRVDVRIVAHGLTQKQARLIESVLILEHAKHHDIFNRAVSITLPEKYVAKYRKSRSRLYVTSGDPQKESNDRYRNSTKGREAAELKRTYLRTSEGRRHNQLSAAISYARKKGKPTEHLESERRGLMTFAEWRKTAASK